MNIAQTKQIDIVDFLKAIYGAQNETYIED